MTEQNDTITTQLISLDEDLAPGNSTTPKDVVLETLAHKMLNAGRIGSEDDLLEAIYAREAQSATGLAGGIAIPHCRTATATEATLGFARLKAPADFGAEDGPADIVFMIVAPDGSGKAHLKILSTLARALVKKDFVTALREAQSPEEIVELVNAVLEKRPLPTKGQDATGTATASARSEKPAETSGKPVKKIVGITACPTGIAHTYMAADSLTQAADERPDVDLIIETQGATPGRVLTQAEIDAADAVICATEVGVRDSERFAGKPTVQVPVKKGISDPNGLIDQAIALSDAEPASAGGSGASVAASAQVEEPKKQSIARQIQEAVLTGVSYMLPFVAAGGLLLAISFLLGSYNIGSVEDTVVSKYSLWNLPPNDVVIGGVTPDHSGIMLYLGSVCFVLGTIAMGFLVAALSGYIAYALAGRTGIAPGFVGGAVSVMIGAGFIGGLVTGIIAGYVALWLTRAKVPQWAAGLMPVVVIPLLTTFITGGAMFFLLGQPIASFMDWMQSSLTSMSGSSAALLGIVLGLMMCSDMGGPINKAAYLFATAGLSTGDEASLKIMAAVMISGMVAPIALSLAAFIRPQVFSNVERENAKTSWLLGSAFISEGAIPFAAADPLRVIPSMMLGGATAGAISMSMGVGSYAPHGGIFVLFAVENRWGFLIALLAGVAVAALAVVLAKQFWPAKNKNVEQDMDDALVAA